MPNRARAEGQPHIGKPAYDKLPDVTFPKLELVDTDTHNRSPQVADGLKGLAERMAKVARTRQAPVDPTWLWPA
jgi:hypothetical protein